MSGTSLWGSRRRRIIALTLALLLVAVAVGLVLMLMTRPTGQPPQGVPTSAVPSAPSTSSPTTLGSPGTAQPGTETPEAGQTPVQPPATVPPFTGRPTPQPTGTGPADPPRLPAAPFPASLRGQDLTVIPGAGRVVALTFDAGANSEGLPKILSTLASQGVKGTFFLTGNWAATNPASVARIVAAGHRVGNHSMTHPGFIGLSDDLIHQQVLGAEQAILQAGGDPRPLFRFPYGERDARTIATVNNLGYACVRWTVDTLGWKGTSGGISVQTVADRVLGALTPGEIVLMHVGSNPDDGSTLDADALPQVIDRIRAAGYGFVTLDALLTG